MKISILRFNPDQDKKPYMQDYEIERTGVDVMLLDLLIKIKALDDSLSMRMSCREGVCGSDAMNINGKNGLACITMIDDLKQPIIIRPMPGLPIVRDLVVNMDQFFDHYHSIKPYLINHDEPPKKERLQSPKDRKKLDGLYECILCGACTTACPSFWWKPDKFVGPAALLQAYRFMADSRDQGDEERLENLDDPDRLYRCHNIMNCADVCPKGLSPTKAIGNIKQMQLKSKKKGMKLFIKNIFPIKEVGR
ncbi:MAG: succinate dehydrogenase iron-sulfur subunit [Methylophilaceae bacterium]|jgi:succinate dehydrogenase / fumarate reductase iron-sulfur subunit